MLKKIIPWVLILSLCGICQIGLATNDNLNYQPQPQAYATKGIYAEANGGVSFVHINDVFGFSFTETGFGGNANVGYQFNRYFALEGGYTGFYIDSSYFNAVDAAIKGILPLDSNNRVKLFAKVGPSFVFANGDGLIGILGGLGIGIGLSQNLDLNLQFQDNLIPGASFGLGSVGLTYHFA